jgi:hypothetical protein
LFSRQDGNIYRDFKNHLLVLKRAVMHAPEQRFDNGSIHLVALLFHLPNKNIESVSPLDTAHAHMPTQVGQGCH